MTSKIKDKPSDSGRFLLLDGLRGIAAFVIIVDHVRSESLLAVLPGRYLAVDFFLVLSGLVLARAYGAILGTPGSTWKFMKTRLIRLYPFYLLGLSLGITIAVLAALRGWSPFIAHEFAIAVGMGLLFLPTPTTIHTDSQALFPFDPPTWTLFFELVANLFYALTFRFLSWAVLIVLLIILGALSTYGILSSPDVGPGYTWAEFDTGLARILFTFMLGVMLHRILHLAPGYALPAALVAVLFIIVVAFPTTEDLRRPYDAFAAIVLMPALIFVAAYSKVSGNVARLCKWLGMVSYGVYILHLPIYLAFDIVFAALGIFVPGALKVLIVAFTAAAITHVVGILFEEKIRAYLMNRFVKKQDAMIAKPPRSVPTADSF